MENTQPSTAQAASLPLVALVGPTNAGKSTLFNRLTGSWQAITAKEISTTRDRVYGEVEWQGSLFSLVDTGGLVDDESELYQKIHNQTLSAIEEADLVLFVFDGIEGLDDRAKNFLNSLRGKKPLWLVANKIDALERESKKAAPNDLGLPYYEVSGISGRGSGDLLESISQFLPVTRPVKPLQPLIAFIGRPNVGKSSLLNALVKSERAVVSPLAGTTRDIVTAELELGDQKYLLADTAGVRRRGQIERGPESFSVKRTLTAIAQADAVIVLVDASEGTVRGDLHLLYYAKELGKPTLLLFNKIDLLDAHQQVQIHGHANRFDQLFISAKDSTNIHAVAEWITTHNQPAAQL